MAQIIERLSLITNLSSIVQADDGNDAAGEEISRIVQEQRRLEAKYEELIAQRSSLKAVANKTKLKQNEDEIADVARRLKQSTRQLCRNLQDNPNLEGNIQKIQSVRGALIGLMEATVQELLLGNFDTLQARVEKEAARQENMAAVLAREKALSTKVWASFSALTT